MAEPLDLFARQLASRRSPRTVTSYLRTIRAFLEARAALAARKSDVEVFLGRPRRDGAPRSAATRNQELAALRAFSSYAVRELGWSEDPTVGIAFLREPPHDPPVLSANAIRALFETADQVRNARCRALCLALLGVLTQAALRVHEVTLLDLSQVDLAGATLVCVRGKGGSVHDLPLNAPTVVLLSQWIAVRATLAEPEEPALFLSSRGTRISIRAVQRLVANLGRRSSSGRRVWPHLLRHSAATLCLSLGADISTVGELLRHGDLNVTRRYLHLVDTRRREAVTRLGASIPPSLLGIGVQDARPGEPPQLPQDSSAERLDVQHPLDGEGREAA
ncbi:MAG: tyrosine-type recombinase/integrase [Deltaproteobacteria bacterium]|nr:tyrosine-type recombinase/integrase [Deltaproteobacteria bacterium]